MEETISHQWIGTAERKYYEDGKCFIKRSLRPSEYLTGYRGLHIPPLGKQRLANEAASLRYIREHTNIPVPTVYCAFEEDDSYYLITEYVDGVSMVDLSQDQKDIVCKELEDHITTMRALTSNRLGGPSGTLIPPYRVLKHAETKQWNMKLAETSEYVFCHNDLSQQNVIVDPTSLKVNAIIEWEYAGYFPRKFECPFFYRRGPSPAIGDETDDSSDLLAFLYSQDIGQ